MDAPKAARRTIPWLLLGALALFTAGGIVLGISQQESTTESLKSELLSPQQVGSGWRTYPGVIVEVSKDNWVSPHCWDVHTSFGGPTAYEQIVDFAHHPDVINEAILQPSAGAQQVVNMVRRCPAPAYDRYLSTFPSLGSRALSGLGKDSVGSIGPEDSLRLRAIAAWTVQGPNLIVVRYFGGASLSQFRQWNAIAVGQVG
jgi:hypothetical protein